MKDEAIKLLYKNIDVVCGQIEYFIRFYNQPLDKDQIAFINELKHRVTIYQYILTVLEKL